MDFFIPGTRDVAEAESVYASICAIVRENTGVRPAPRKIRSVEFRESGYREVATVGSYFEYELVSCILETTDEYLVYTPNRGLRRGNPTRVSKSKVINVTTFAAEPVRNHASVHRLRGQVG
jgi:hypothetical protein